MSKERGKIRGFYFEIDGDSDVLQEGLKNFGAALGRALTTHPPKLPKALPGPKANGATNSEAEDDEVDAELDDDILDSTDEKKTKKPGARKPPPMPEVLELNLDGKDGVSLKDFATRKNPGTISDKFLVIAAWFRDHAGIGEITTDHVFTCFKIMDWTPHPANYGQVMNDLKRKQKSLDKGDATGAYKINIVGLNLVAKMSSEG